MHLVVGAGEFLGHHVTRALATDVPVIELVADADDETLADAMSGVEVVIVCAQTWSPGRRLRFRKRPPVLLARVLEASRRAGVRRLVHVSTADVYGQGHLTRVAETMVATPSHAYEKLKLYEEEWLLSAAGDIEVVILRPGRIFGEGEDWILPRLVGTAVQGRLWLPGGGRARQTFVAASDVGRACLAASDRGRPGHRYLVGGFDSSWRELVVSAARAVGFAAEISSLPYDLAYFRALGAETVAPEGSAAWPGLFTTDALGRTHMYDDSWSRRELTWSPSVGSFEQEMPAMAPWLAQLPEVIEAQEHAAAAAATSRPGR